MAEELGVDIMGTGGVLLLARKRGVVDTVRPLMDALIAAGFRVSDALYQQTLRLAGEASE